MSGRLQNLIIALGLVVLAYLGYYLYSNNSDAVLRSDNAAVANQAASESAEFLRRLNDLKTIELRADIFSDPEFQSLQSNVRPVEELGVGRENPFVSVE